MSTTIMTSVTIMHHHQKHHHHVHHDAFIILGHYDHRDGEHMSMMMMMIGAIVCVCALRHTSHGSMEGRGWNK